MQMANGHMKGCSTSFYWRNANQNYSEISPHPGQGRPHPKGLQTVNAGGGVEKGERSCTVGGNVN